MARTSSLGGGGIHFKEPWELLPHTRGAANIFDWDKATSGVTSATVAFFTELALRGATDTTNWAANTYKTIVNLSGKGLCAGYIGCTAGGAETHTIEITVDGRLFELPIVNASGERAMLMASPVRSDFFTTAAANGYSTGDLNAAKTVIGTSAGSFVVPTWAAITGLGTPCLKFNTSLLIRAKHSAIITNSTATAYSGVIYRMGLA